LAQENIGRIENQNITWLSIMRRLSEDQKMGWTMRRHLILEQSNDWTLDIDDRITTTKHRDRWT